MHRLLNDLILIRLLAEEAWMTDGHHECHAVFIGASPAQTTMLYPSGQQGNARPHHPLAPSEALYFTRRQPGRTSDRTAAFLLLKDSRPSFEIEGEHPPHERIQCWGRAIGEAGRKSIDLDELLRL